jgi:hypothetical protein
MQIFPKTKQDWVELLLIPFMVYVLAAPVWLHMWKILAFKSPKYGFLHGDRISYGIWHYERFMLARWYFPCALIFCVAGAIQFHFGWRRSAIVSFIFAAVTLAILFFYLLPLAESK